MERCQLLFGGLECHPEVKCIEFPPVVIEEEQSTGKKTKKGEKADDKKKSKAPKEKTKETKGKNAESDAVVIVYKYDLNPASAEMSLEDFRSGRCLFRCPHIHMELSEAEFWSYLFSDYWNSCGMLRVCSGSTLNRLLCDLDCLVALGHLKTFSVSYFDKCARLLIKSLDGEPDPSTPARIEFTFYAFQEDEPTESNRECPKQDRTLDECCVIESRSCETNEDARSVSSAKVEVTSSGLDTSPSPSSSPSSLGNHNSVSKKQSVKNKAPQSASKALVFDEDLARERVTLYFDDDSGYTSSPQGKLGAVPANGAVIDEKGKKGKREEIEVPEIDLSEPPVGFDDYYFSENRESDSRYNFCSLNDYLREKMSRRIERRCCRLPVFPVIWTESGAKEELTVVKEDEGKSRKGKGGNGKKETKKEAENKKSGGEKKHGKKDGKKGNKPGEEEPPKVRSGPILSEGITEEEGRRVIKSVKTKPFCVPCDMSTAINISDWDVNPGEVERIALYGGERSRTVWTMRDPERVKKMIMKQMYFGEYCWQWWRMEKDWLANDFGPGMDTIAENPDSVRSSLPAESVEETLPPEIPEPPAPEVKKPADGAAKKAAKPNAKEKKAKAKKASKKTEVSSKEKSAEGPPPPPMEQLVRLNRASVSDFANQREFRDAALQAIKQFEVKREQITVDVLGTIQTYTYITFSRFVRNTFGEI